jgi:DNA repair protein RadC
MNYIEFARPLSRVREPAVLYRQFLVCPSCGERVPTTVTGLDWVVRSPTDIADRLLGQFNGKEQEELHVLLLNTKNRVIRQQCVYIGNVSSALARVGELFREAVRDNAAGLILVHNHPSGDPTPSPDDLHLTAEVLTAGRLLDVQVLDHIVLGADTFVSLRDRGIGFERT